MRLSKLLAAVAATSLMAAPAIANPASSLSVVKASTPAKKSSDLAGFAGGSSFAVGLVALVVVIGGIALIADDDDDDQPDSN